jgi:hypothetical protein
MENQIINIDSRFRNKNKYYNPGKFTFELKKKIKNVKYIRLTSIELPNLYFTFSSKKKNNFFKIKINNIEYDIIINDGFYNSSQLLNNIQEKLNELPNNMIINFDLANGIVTIRGDVPFSINFLNTGIYDSLGYHLGFRNNLYNSNNKIVNGISVFYIDGIAPLDVIGDAYVFLKVNDYGKIYNFIDCGSEVIYNYLGKVIVNVNKTEKVFDNNNFVTKEHIFKDPIDINKFDIELLDPLNNIIDMETINFSFTLEIGVI